MLMDVLRHLRMSGVEIDEVADESRDGWTTPPVGDGLIVATVDDRRFQFVVEERKRAPYPGEVDALASLKSQLDERGRPLLVAPFVSEGTGRRLVAEGWSWADEVGNFDLRAPGLVLRQRVAASPPKPKGRSLPQGSGSWSVIRWLIAHGAVTSLSELALHAGVTQPRISQVGGQLERLGLVSRSRTGWLADRAELLDLFLQEYDGPGGSTVYLYSLDEPLDCCLQLASRNPRPSMAISADVAADLLVPWRRPTLVVIYTEARIDVERGIGATPAHGIGDSNIIHRVPEDRSVFAPRIEMDVHGVKLPLANPVQVLWELHTLGGDDRMEQAERLRKRLLSSP